MKQPNAVATMPQKDREQMPILATAVFEPGWFWLDVERAAARMVELGIRARPHPYAMEMNGVGRNESWFFRE